MSIFARAGAVEPDAIIAAVAAPLGSPDPITAAHLAQVIAELRRQNEAHQEHVAAGLLALACVRITSPPAEGGTER